MRSLSRTLTGVVAVVSIATASVATAVVTDPVAYWDFETNLDNQVTLGAYNNATVLTGTPTTGAGGGIVGNALSLDDSTGTGDSIRLPLGTSNLGDSFTISAWYWQENTAIERDFVFEATGNWDVSYGTTNTANTFRSYVGQTAVPGADVTTSYDAWHHVLHTFSTSGANTTLDVYVDDDHKGSYTKATSSVNFPSINVGVYRMGTDRFWDGLIDEVAIWDHALSPSEAHEVYDRGNSGLPLEFSPLEIDLGGAPTQFSMNMESPIPSGVGLSGWGTDTFTPVGGADNDLGDGGFSATTYLRTQGSGNNLVFLNFVSLPAHTEFDLGMIVAQLDSLDPDRDGDRFTVKIDGQELLGVGLGYSDPGDEVIDDLRINGVSTAESVLEAVRTLNDQNVYVNGTYLEHMYDLGQLAAFQDIPHTGSTLTIEIIGYQNQSSGEFYGLDDVLVTIIPEPGTLSLAAMGLLGLLAWGWRRKR